jgi:glycosyltransferase involved in cell wall biosynthesis
MNDALAVFAPFVGVRSETFIRRHVRDLLPGRTVVVTDHAKSRVTGHWSVDGPMFALDEVPSPRLTQRVVKGLARRVGWKSPPDSNKADVLQFLKQHRVGVAMGEFLGWSLEWLHVAQRLEIPFFGHAHGCDVSAELRQPRSREAYLRYNDAGGIITMSEFSRARLVALGIRPEKVHVVPYGIDVPSAGSVRPEPDIVSVLAVGRMTAKKAPILVLDAFRRAVHTFPRLRLDYVGEGELLPAARQFVRAFELDDYVTLHGGRSSDAVIEMMTRADIFVQHSVTDPDTGDEEGLPVAILEAMANSLPVVSTRHAGIPEAVADGETGLLVDEMDSKRMADCLVILARDARLRCSMGMAGWRTARERFTWHRERSDLCRILGLNGWESTAATPC